MSKDIVLHDRSVVRITDSKNIKLRVEYTYKGTTYIDYGDWNVQSNVYFPGYSQDEDEDHYYALQERVEA